MKTREQILEDLCVQLLAILVSETDYNRIHDDTVLEVRMWLEHILLEGEVWEIQEFEPIMDKIMAELEIYVTIKQLPEEIDTSDILKFDEDIKRIREKIKG